MELTLKSAIKPGDKFDGGKWFSIYTLYEAINKFLSDPKKNCYLCKGNGSSGKMYNSITVAKSSRIGVIKDIAIMSVTVDIDESKIPESVLELITDNKFKVYPRLIITDIDEDTNEILNMRILSYDLILKENCK